MLKFINLNEMVIFLQTCSKLGKSLLLLFFVGYLPIAGIGQPLANGSVDALRRNNGFKEIKLGTDIGKLKGGALYFLDGDEKLDVDSCLKFEYRNAEILKLNDITLDLVGLRTYNSKIINVYLFFKRGDGYKILQNFIGVYGKCTAKPGDFMYDWKSNQVMLSLRFQATSDLGVAIFTYTPFSGHLASAVNKAKQTLELSAVNLASY